MSFPTEKSSSDALAREVARRRTFAIISHPDAGKTTLTEKLLFYAGALHLAGAVQARSNQRAAKSDWMELEQARGISITSTALQFDYRVYGSICSIRRATKTSAKTPTVPLWRWIVRSWSLTAPKVSSRRPKNSSPSVANEIYRS